jgi:hypothetical protein
MTDEESMMAGPGTGGGGKVYRRNADASYTQFGDEGLIVVPRQSMNVVVNATGLRVFELLDGQRPVKELAGQVAEEFDEGPTREEIEADVSLLLEELASKGAVELVDQRQSD